MQMKKPSTLVMATSSLLAFVTTPIRLQEQCIVPITSAYLPVKSHPFEVKQNQRVEALLELDQSIGLSNKEQDQGAECRLLDSYACLNLPSWWPCVVTKVCSSVALVRPIPDFSPASRQQPLSSMPPLDLISKIESIVEGVELTHLRPISQNPQPLQPGQIKRHIINLPKDVIEFASDPSFHSDVKDYFTSNNGINNEGPLDTASLLFDASSSSLVILTLHDFVLKRVRLLEDSYLKLMKQKCAVLRQVAASRRRVTSQDFDGGSIGSRSGYASLGRSFLHGPPRMRRTTQGGLDGDLSAVNDPLFAHHEVFRVEQPLVGLAIGAQGHNIRSARGLPGIGAIDMIDFVQLRDSVSSSSYDDSYSYRAIPQQRSRKAGRDRDSQDAALSQPDLVYEPNRSGLVPCSVFSIYAKDAESARPARSLLEFTEMHICVPRRFVGRLIGRQTANIQSVIDKSGVSHIHFNDHPAGPPSPSPAGTDDAVIANGVSGNRFPLIISYETHQAWETWLEAHFMKQFLGDGAHKSPPALPAGVPPPPAPPPLGYRHNILIRYGSDAMGQSSDSGHLDCTGANSQEDFCSFVITGRRESVDSARLLLSFHIDYIKKLEDLELKYNLPSHPNMQSYCSSGKDHDPNEFSFDDTDGVAMMDYMNDDEQTGEDDLEDEANGTGESSGGGWVRRRRPHYAGRQQQRGHSNARYHHGSVMAADGDEDSLQGAEWSDQLYPSEAPPRPTFGSRPRRTHNGMMDSRNPSRRGYNGGYFRDTAYYSQRNSTAGSRTLPASSGRGSNNQQLQQQSQHSYISSDRRPDRIRTAGRGRSGLYHLQHPQISDQSDMSHQVASRQSYAQQPLETKNGRVSSSGPRESNFSGPNKRGNQEHRHKGVGGVNDSSRHFSAAQQPARFSEQRSTEGPEMATSNSVSRRRNAPSSTAVAGYHHDKQHELLEPDNSVGGQEGRSVNDGEDSRCHPPQSDNIPGPRDRSHLDRTAAILDADSMLTPAGQGRSGYKGNSTWRGARGGASRGRQTGAVGLNGRSSVTLAELGAAEAADATVVITNRRSSAGSRAQISGECGDTTAGTTPLNSLPQGDSSRLETQANRTHQRQRRRQTSGRSISVGQSPGDDGQGASAQGHSDCRQSRVVPMEAATSSECSGHGQIIAGNSPASSAPMSAESTISLEVPLQSANTSSLVMPARPKSKTGRQTGGGGSRKNGGSRDSSAIDGTVAPTLATIGATSTADTTVSPC